ncbi:MAG: hypothetical protein RIR39_2099 [Pseudomonadota bacterium]
MLIKADFQRIIADSISNYPAIAPFYNAGDPRIIQHLDSMAAMLAAISSQLEVAMSEPFDKVRDATILADAALRGVILKGKPARVTIAIENSNNTPFLIDTGRVIIDSSGYYYSIETSATIPAYGTGTFVAVQQKTESFAHTVSGSTAFYPIEIPTSDDDSYLSHLSVSDSNGEFEYRNRYINTYVNERIYNVEMDDIKRVYVRFGQQGIVGTQPLDGDVFTINVTRTHGKILPALNSPFSFEYNLSLADSLVKMSMSNLVFGGENPLTTMELRDLAKYPAIYQTGNAVFLGEFDFLIRSNFPDVQFLSVWNESIEEVARVPSVDHINKLFVAVFSNDGLENILIETDPKTPVAPIFIDPNVYTVTQQSIVDLVKNADDSYKVKFYTPVISKIATSITATVSTSYVSSEIRSKIIEVILANYGAEAAASKRGSNQPLYREIYALLKEKIPALSDGRADLKVSIAEPVGILKPELWRYVAVDSLTVTVSTLNIIQNGWGGR